MPRMSKFTQLEKEEGKPIGEILVEKLNELQTIGSLAAEIHVSEAYTSRKLTKLRIKRKTIWVQEEGGDDDATR